MGDGPPERTNPASHEIVPASENLPESDLLLGLFFREARPPFAQVTVHYARGDARHKVLRFGNEFHVKVLGTFFVCTVRRSALNGTLKRELRAKPPCLPAGLPSGLGDTLVVLLSA